MTTTLKIATKTQENILLKDDIFQKPNSFTQIKITDFEFKHVKQIEQNLFFHSKIIRTVIFDTDLT